MERETIVAITIAAWGAFTGTIALVVQVLQHLNDKEDLCLKGRMTISSNIQDPVSRYQLELSVVYKGRRIARISSVYIRSGSEKDGFRYVLFDAQDVVVSLAEGESHVFQQRIMTNSLNGMFESFSDYEYFTVQLTTGKEYQTKFKSLKFSSLPDLLQ